MHLLVLDYYDEGERESWNSSEIFTPYLCRLMQVDYDEFLYPAAKSVLI